MKYIEKGPAPAELERWKALVNRDWEPDFDNMTRAVKDDLKGTLIHEQGGLCCYCEKSIDMNDSHLEHFQPQSDENIDPLDYANLLCSCMQSPIRGEIRHCGHCKGNWFDEELLISPLDPECGDAFAFDGDGHIFPNHTRVDAAATTIKKLGLDCEKLVALRRAALVPFLDPDLDSVEFLEFVDGYLGRRDDGMFNAHWSAVRFVFS